MNPGVPAMCGTILCLSAFVLLSAPARAQEHDGDPAKGRIIAQTWCSACHVVSPDQQHAGSDAVPSFAAIARMSSTTSMSLHAFLQTPHPPMPDLKLTHNEMDDLDAYILSLRQR